MDKEYLKKLISGEIEATNEDIRQYFNKIYNCEFSSPFIVTNERLKEIRESKEKYERKRIEFYNNPYHWTNNKRRRNGLKPLRKSKNRSLTFGSYNDPTFFYMIEDLIAEVLEKSLNFNFFNKFVEVKNFYDGDKNIFYVN